MSSFALRREWLVVALLFVLMIVKGVLWSLAFPLWQGPDEDDHYAVIQFIGENGRLPNTADTILPDEITLSRALADVGRLDCNPEQRQGWSDGALSLQEAEFDALPFSSRTGTELGTTAKLMHATPLYYLIAAIPYRLIGYNQNLLVRMQLQRLLEVLVSSPIVVVAYLIAQRLFPQDAGLRLTIPILVAFQPQLTQMTAVIFVDGLFFVLYSLLIYLCLRVLRDGLDGKTAVLIGLAFAAAFLIKPTINGFAPLVALVVLYDWWRRKGERWRVMGAAAIMNAVILPPAAWWMARSWRINHRSLQGRYWLGTVIPMLAFFAADLLAWLPTWWQPVGHSVLRIGMITLNFISLLGYIMPRYHL